MKVTSKEKNEGTLKIANTIFNIGAIQNFSEMQKYVETYFAKE